MNNWRHLIKHLCLLFKEKLPTTTEDGSVIGNMQAHLDASLEPAGS